MSRTSILAPKKGAKVIAPKRKGLVDQKRVTKVIFKLSLYLFLAVYEPRLFPKPLSHIPVFVIRSCRFVDVGGRFAAEAFVGGCFHLTLA